MKLYGKRNSLFQNFVMSQLAALQVIFTEGGGSCQLRPASDRESTNHSTSPSQGDKSTGHSSASPTAASSSGSSEQEELAASMTAPGEG